MTSYEWAEENPTITRKTVVRLLANHGIAVAEFDAEFPRADAYDSEAVLGWMGY